MYDVDYGLWAYDHSGRIYRYSVKKDSFDLLFVLSSFIQGEIILNKLCFAPDGVLWLGLSTGLFKMEQAGDIHLVLEDSYVNDILSIADSLYVGTSDGMIVYNRRASTLVK